jgi:PAS domain S-box-containing protein
MEQAVMNRELRILMLEDTPTDAELAEHELRKAGIAFTSMRVETRDTFIRALAEFHPDIVLSDYKLPDFDGMSALEIVQRDHPEVPVIMLTGALSDIQAVELIRAGAKDYVLKDRLARLAPAVQRALAAAQDARSRLAAEKALKESQERLKFALEGAGDGVWDWNPQTDVALFSRRWKEMIGYAEHEFPSTGAAWVEHLHPDDKDRMLSAVREYFSGSQPFYVVEYRLRCKDGSWKWILSRGKLISRDVDGSPLRMIGTHTDITERKRAELALQRESEKNLALLRNASDGIHILDTDGNIIEVSDSFCAMLGYRRDEMIGMNVSQWDAQLTDAERTLKVKQQFAQQGRSQFETCHRRKDGTIFDVEVSGFPLELDGKPALFNSSRDISERKLMALQLVERESLFHAIFNQAPNAVELIDLETLRFVEACGWLTLRPT